MMACSLQNETGCANLLLGLCAAEVLSAIGMFNVTMVTGSASVGVTTAYSPSPLKPLISWWMSSTPSLYSSEIPSFWLLNIDKKPNLGWVKVTLFPCVIGTKLDVRPVIPWTTLW